METLKGLLYSGDAENLVREVSRLLDAKVSPARILNEGLIAGMAVVGERFKRNETFIPEVLISADAMQAAMKILEPHLVKAGVKPMGKVVIGTVKGDLHDIGKNLVSMMLKGAGFEIEDCGIDVAPQRFVDTLRKTNAGILAMSALLTTSMPSIRLTIEALEAGDMRDRVKVMVGGAPLSEGFARKVGADGYGKDAAEAVDLAKEFMAKIEVR